jgi:regulator of RNase E activity RraA
MTLDVTPDLTPDALALLHGADTPTVCNAIEVVEGRRGFANFTRATVLASDPAARLVGFAATAKLRALRPPEEDAATIRARRMDYYRMVALAPKPSLVVIEDEDAPHAVGAFWGEINTTIHKGLGLSGALTNGVMRDLGDLPEGFPVIAGSVGPSHGFVHVTALAVPVTVFGLTVAPGDLVHADRHGAVVVPTPMIPEIGQAIAKLRATEAIILDAARRPGFDLAAFERAWAAFEAARV